MYNDQSQFEKQLVCRDFFRKFPTFVLHEDGITGPNTQAQLSTWFLCFQGLLQENAEQVAFKAQTSTWLFKTRVELQ